jgi:hypothetical protein
MDAAFFYNRLAGFRRILMAAGYDLRQAQAATTDSQAAPVLIQMPGSVVGSQTIGFGIIIAVATCYAGLARPLTLPDVAPASTRGVVLGVTGCLLLDAALFPLWWLIGSL